ncbi:MAG: cohesin domain-containing protein [Bryobacteraceae bacterium]
MRPLAMIYPGLSVACVKRMLLAALAFFLSVSVAFSEKLFLPFESAAPGASLVLPVTFISQTGSLAAVQFDLQYDSTAMSITANAGEAARNSGKRLYSADLAANKRRFLIVGLNQNVIPSGSLVDLFVNLKPNAPNGLYPLAISEALGATPRGQPELLSAVDDGAVQVLGNLSEGARLPPGGILNAASLLAGPVAPGEVVTLMGSAIGPASAQQPSISPTSIVLGGTRVLFDGTAAPLLYAAPNQINLIVPFGVSGKATTRMQITDATGVIAQVSLPVAAMTPGLFTQDSSGTGPGAILNQDSTVNSPSNPAVRGAVVALFATGAGQTNPPGTDGQVNGEPSRKFFYPGSVLIGGVEAEVLYAGDAPGLVAGIVQVNCRIPSSVLPAYEVPIILRIGTASSQLGVTLAVQ